MRCLGWMSFAKPNLAMARLLFSSWRHCIIFIQCPERSMLSFLLIPVNSPSRLKMSIVGFQSISLMSSPEYFMEVNFKVQETVLVVISLLWRRISERRLGSFTDWLFHHARSKIWLNPNSTHQLPGVSKRLDIEALKAEVPSIVVGTPGRIMDLCTTKIDGEKTALNLFQVQLFAHLSMYTFSHICIHVSQWLLTILQ